MWLAPSSLGSRKRFASRAVPRLLLVVLVLGGWWWYRHRAERSAGWRLDPATEATLSRQVAEAHAARWQRQPLFGGSALPGNALLDYLVAGWLTEALIDQYGEPAVDHDVAMWRLEPVPAVVATAGARQVAALVVRGADRGWVAWNLFDPGYGTYGAVSRLVMAAAVYEYRYGDPRRAYRWVVATQRMAEDLVRVSENASVLLLTEQRHRAVSLLGHFAAAGRLAAADRAALLQLEARVVGERPSLRDLLLRLAQQTDATVHYLHLFQIDVTDTPVGRQAGRLHPRPLEGMARAGLELTRRWQAIDSEADPATTAVAATVGCRQAWQATSPCMAAHTLIRHEVRNQSADRDLLGALALAAAFR